MSDFFPELKGDFAAALDQLKGHKVAVLGHVRPDGDCVGSQVAVTRILRARGIEAVAVNEHAVPTSLTGFVGETPFLKANAFDPSGHTLVTTDCADKKRLGLEFAPRLGEVFLNIDHHISNSLYGQVNLISDRAAATAEILAGLFFDLDIEVDATTAQALYVGIATDTGQFRFPSTTRQVFEVTGRLLDCGAHPGGASLALYENESFEKIRLLQRFLKSLRLECDGRVCIGLLDRNAYKETGATIDDSEGLVDYARSIAGVEIGVLLEERDGAIKGSLRAKDGVHRVDRMAKRFHGGGHAAAAGFNMEGTLDEFLPHLIGALQDHFASRDEAVAAS